MQVGPLGHSFMTESFRKSWSTGWRRQEGVRNDGAVLVEWLPARAHTWKGRPESASSVGPEITGPFPRVPFPPTATAIRAAAEAVRPPGSTQHLDRTATANLSPRQSARTRTQPRGPCPPLRLHQHELPCVAPGWLSPSRDLFLLSTPGPKSPRGTPGLPCGGGPPRATSTSLSLRRDAMGP